MGLARCAARLARARGRGMLLLLPLLLLLLLPLLLLLLLLLPPLLLLLLLRMLGGGGRGSRAPRATSCCMGALSAGPMRRYCGVVPLRVLLLLPCRLLPAHPCCSTGGGAPCWR